MSPRQLGFDDGNMTSRGPAITRLTQSIDLTDYYRGVKHVETDKEFKQRINKKVSDFNQDLSDLKLVLTEEFQEPVKRIQELPSPVDFDQYFSEKTDLKYSPFPDAKVAQER